jgi:SdrD B-like domain
VSQLSRLLRSPGETSGTQGGERGPAPRCRPELEVLEDRWVPSTLSSITSNFNGTAIPADDFVWFNSVAKVQGVTSAPVTLHVVDQSITFTANGTPYSLSVPDTLLTLDPSATSATTTFDAGSNEWITRAPAALSGNVFLGGVAFPAAAGLPGGIKNVTWKGDFATDTPGIKVNWQWAAAAYSQFSGDEAALGVKPVDAPKLSVYQNSDHAGTPENFKAFVLGGARGGGGSNFTGSYSSTAFVVPDVGSSPASIGGFVFADFNNNGVMEPGEFGIGGAVITLTGWDNQGNQVTLTTSTNPDGSYNFTGLAPGTYTLTRSAPIGYDNGLSSVGTVNGNTDGSALLDGSLAGIGLQGGDQGVNYNFGEIFAGS